MGDTPDLSPEAVERLAKRLSIWASGPRHTFTADGEGTRRYLNEDCAAGRDALRALSAALEAERVRVAIHKLRADLLRDSIALIKGETLELAAQVAEKPLLPCDLGGDLCADPYTAETVAAAIRKLSRREGRE